MARLFGTDGVRGIANEELTPLMAMQLGQAGAYVLTKQTQHKPTIMVGCDTRISGDMLANALMAGVCSVGANAVYVGVIPTPAVAYLTRKYKVDAGVVISASHNPVEFNGIKFFNGDGYKLSDELEDEIEALKSATTNTDKFIALAKKYIHIKELTPEVLLTFVSKIVIHERSEKRSKSATQQIDIYFTHIGNAGQI